jgi:hypothetical protein
MFILKTIRVSCLEKLKTEDMEAIIAIVDNKSGRLKLSSTITAEKYQ